MCCAEYIPSGDVKFVSPWGSTQDEVRTLLHSTLWATQMLINVSTSSSLEQSQVQVSRGLEDYKVKIHTSHSGLLCCPLLPWGSLSPPPASWGFSLLHPPLPTHSCLAVCPRGAGQERLTCLPSHPCWDAALLGAEPGQSSRGGAGQAG